MIIAELLLAGKGTRAKTKVPKQFIKIKNQEMFLYPLKTFLNIEEINKIILVVDKNSFAKVKRILDENEISLSKVHIVIGGETRTKSSFLGLDYIKKNFPKCKYVLIHDACRPLVSRHIILKNIKAVQKYDATSTYIDSSDTLITKKGYFLDTYLDRSLVFQLQTPQCFKFSLIYKNALANIENTTDDTFILRNKKYNIKLVKGDSLNFKVTTNADLKILMAIIGKKDV